MQFTTIASLLLALPLLVSAVAMNGNSRPLIEKRMPTVICDDCLDNCIDITLQSSNFKKYFKRCFYANCRQICAYD